MFKPGQSGNPKGRKPGKGKYVDIRDALKRHKMELLQKVVDLALEGDTTALKLCLERICPPIKSCDEPVQIPMSADATLSERSAAIIQAMAAGDLSPDTAARLLSALADHGRLIQTEELERRIAALESGHTAQENPENVIINK